MTGWSYSGDPSNTPLDEVRFLLGDTTQIVQSLSDSEINWLIAQQNPANTYWAAADAANLMAGRFLRLSGTMKKVGDLQLEMDYAATASRYSALSRELMKGRTRFSIGVPMVADVTPAQFSIGIMDDPTSNPITTLTETWNV